MLNQIKHSEVPRNISLALHYFWFIEISVLCFLLGEKKIKQNGWENFLKATSTWMTHWFSWLGGFRNLDSNPTTALSSQERIPNNSEAANKVLKICSLLSISRWFFSVASRILLPSSVSFLSTREVLTLGTCRTDSIQSFPVRGSWILSKVGEF